MKKIFALTAATMILAATTTFASCPLKSMNNACSMGVPTGAAAPVSYIVGPAYERAVVPPCQNCCNKEKKGFFSKIFTPVQGIYDATLGQIFTGLY